MRLSELSEPLTMGSSLCFRGSGSEDDDRSEMSPSFRGSASSPDNDAAAADSSTEHPRCAACCSAHNQRCMRLDIQHESHWCEMLAVEFYRTCDDRRLLLRIQ